MRLWKLYLDKKYFQISFDTNANIYVFWIYCSFFSSNKFFGVKGILKTLKNGYAIVKLGRIKTGICQSLPD